MISVNTDGWYNEILHNAYKISTFDNIKDGQTFICDERSTTRVKSVM